MDTELFKMVSVARHRFSKERMSEWADICPGGFSKVFKSGRVARHRFFEERTSMWVDTHPWNFSMTGAQPVYT